MQLDIGPTDAETATPGIPATALDRLDARIEDVHATIQMERNRETFGYAALDPSPALDRIQRVADRFSDADHLVVVGIGGSALPAAAVADPLVDPNDLSIHLLDNADPDSFRRTIADLDLSRTVVNVVSRSGHTAETLLNFRELRSEYASHNIDWTTRTVLTTGSSGPLHTLADERDVSVLPAPSAAPGRFGVFSAVGLFPLALAHVDISSFMDGARSRAAALGESLYDSPPYALAAVLYGLARRDAATTVLWPYSDRLLGLVEWTAQLFAESLGKDGLGITPIRARGTTDQHAHLQLYRAGPRDKVAVFLDVRSRSGDRRSGDDRIAPDAYDETSLGELQQAARRATAASLTHDGRPNVTVSISDMSPASIGGLAYDLMATTIALGELMDVEAFDQPAVEWGKRATRGLLGDPDCAAEGEMVESLPSRVIE